MILKLKIDVADEVEAYQITSLIGFEHKVLRADLDGNAEDFDEINRPAHFLKPMGKVNLKFREKDDKKFND